MNRKILIQAIFRRKSRLGYRVLSSPTQDKPFEIGLRIKNIDNKDFPGGKIRNLEIQSSENKKIYEPFDEEFSIRSLNPNEVFEVWIPNPLSTYLSGLVWISCDVVPSDSEDKIVTYQKDRNTLVEKKYPDENKWGDESYIFDKLESEQSTTNGYLLVLTIISVMQGVWGLNNLLKWFLESVSTLLLSSGHYLSTIIH